MNLALENACCLLVENIFVGFAAPASRRHVLDEQSCICMFAAAEQGCAAKRSFGAGAFKTQEHLAADETNAGYKGEAVEFCPCADSRQHGFESHAVRGFSRHHRGMREPRAIADGYD